MTLSHVNTDHFSDSRKLWIAAATLALLINLILLSVMPSMNLAPPSLSEEMLIIPAVTIARAREPEPVRKKILPPEKKKLKAPNKKLLEKVVVPKPPVTEQLRLPFHLDARLKNGWQTLPDLPIQTVALNDVDIAGIFSVNQLDEPLVAVSRVPPLYPIRAKREGIEGWVEVRFLINEQGRAEQVEILEATPKNIFEQSVERCVFKWRFKTPTVNGEPVKVRVSTTVRFELEK